MVTDRSDSRLDPGQVLARIDRRHDDLLERIDRLNDEILSALSDSLPHAAAGDALPAIEPA